MKNIMDDAVRQNERGHEKIRTHFAHVFVEKHMGELYYSIIWYDEEEDVYFIGYSSYHPEFVFKWLEENFEIINRPPKNKWSVGVPDGVGI